MAEFLTWLESTTLSVLIREHPSLLAFPLILFLHTLGLAMLAGVSVAIDLWLLRVATIERATSLRGLLATMWLGLGISTVSGLALLLAYPAKALTNEVFYTKLVLVALALIAATRINTAMFPNGGTAGGTLVTPGVKRWAAVSLVFWAGAVLTGRLLACTHSVLMAYELE
jgi:hypothetical protein